MRGIISGIIVNRKIAAATASQDAVALGNMLPTASARERAAIFKALGSLKDSDAAFWALIEYLHNTDARLRALAASALGDLGNARAVKHLAHQLKTETDERAAEAVRRAMEELQNERNQ